jgi:hypothetical protein
MKTDITHLDQQVIVEDGESLHDIAKELMGPKGTASYEILGRIHGDQWPTIRFTGSVHALAAIAAKANGSRIGRPRSTVRAHQDELGQLEELLGRFWDSMGDSFRPEEHLIIANAYAIIARAHDSDNRYPGQPMLPGGGAPDPSQFRPDPLDPDAQ